MEAEGLIVIASGIFSGAGAVIFFRRAADPMATLARIKARTGVDYTRTISDPVRYSTRMARLSAFSGVFLSIVSLTLLVAGVIMLASPSQAERQAEAARLRQAMDQSDREMRDYLQRQDAERMKHIWDVHPPTTLPR